MNLHFLLAELSTQVTNSNQDGDNVRSPPQLRGPRITFHHVDPRDPNFSNQINHPRPPAVRNAIVFPHTTSINIRNYKDHSEIHYSHHYDIHFLHKIYAAIRATLRWPLAPVPSAPQLPTLRPLHNH